MELDCLGFDTGEKNVQRPHLHSYNESCDIRFVTVWEFSLGQSDYARCQSCQTIGALLVIFICVSYSTLALLALDRLLCIKWPFKYRRYASTKLAIVLILIVWIINIILAILPAIGFGDIGINVLGFCSPVYSSEIPQSDSTIYFLLLILVGLFPFTLSSVANLWIVCFACKINKQQRQSRSNVSQYADISNNSLGSQNLRQRIHLAILFGAIFVTDTVLLLPFIITAIILSASKTSTIPTAVNAVLYLSVIVQSVIHPVLETCVVGKATKEMHKFLCSCVQRRKDNKTSVKEI